MLAAFALSALLVLGSPGAPPRTYRLGFTPWPSELSQRGLDTAATFLKENGDLTSQMLIGGVPWVEALAGKPYSADVRAKLAFRAPKGHKLFLSISPLSMDRKSLAPYWGERDNLPLPPEWAGLPFDHPNVVRAMTRFTLDAVRAMKPDYLAIGVESNCLISNDPAAWPAYKRLHIRVYRAVKGAFPGLPVFFTTEVNHLLERALEAKGKPQMREVEDLMRYSDLFAMSYYPHMTYETRWPLPADTFDFARRFRKPIAVSETGMTSRDTNVGLILSGTPERQDEFYRRLFTAADRDRYRFIVTFATTDFERLIPALPPEARSLAAIWQFTGLQTSDGALKPAGVRWRAALARPLSESAKRERKNGQSE